MVAECSNDKADRAQYGDREGPSLVRSLIEGCKEMARIDMKDGNLEKKSFT